MKPAKGFLSECQRAGYIQPLYRPKYVGPLMALDNADDEVAQQGAHLGSAWVEHRILQQLRSRATHHYRVEALAYAWDSIATVWLESVRKREGRVMLGGAASHGVGRAKRRLGQLKKIHQADPEEIQLLDDQHRRETSGLRINDPSYCLSAEDAALRFMEADEIGASLCRLPLMEYEAVVGLLRGRTRHQTARLVGVTVSQVRYAENNGLARLRLGGEWTESSWEDFVLAR